MDSMFFDSSVFSFDTLISMLVSITIAIVVLVAKWRIYEKADYHGWTVLIPFYRSYILYEMVTGEGIMFLLGYVPLVSVVMNCYIAYKLAKAFGKDIGYTLGLIFFPPIFYCMLGFGGAEYKGVD